MKKKNLATAMAAAMAFGAVTPAVANANEPQGRAIVDGTVADGTVADGGEINVALANGKETQAKGYLDIYNTNFTDKTSDDTLVGDFEILYTEGIIPTNVVTTSDAATVKFVVSTQLENTTTNKTDIAKEKANLEDTVAFIKDMIAKEYYVLDGKVEDIANADAGTTAKIVKLKPTTKGKESGRTENLKYTFKGVAVEHKEEVEIKIALPANFDSATKQGSMAVTTTSGVTELNNFVYSLNTNKENIIVENKNNGLNDLDIVVYKKTEEGKKGERLGTFTLVNFKEFKKSEFKGYVDIAGMADIKDLDLPELAWAKESVIDALAKGEMTGDQNGFRAGDSITRAEFAKIIVTIGNVNNGDNKETESFTDVNGEWFAPYVATLETAGIVEGDGNGTFRPEDAITRQEAAVMIAALNNAGYNKVDKFNATTGKAIDSKTEFKDDKNIELWADGSVKYLQLAGISNGDQNKNFNPATNITRAEATVMLKRAVKNDTKVVGNDELATGGVTATNRK